jgi:hypothetical protein
MACTFLEHTLRRHSFYIHQELPVIIVFPFGGPLRSVAAFNSSPCPTVTLSAVPGDAFAAGKEVPVLFSLKPGITCGRMPVDIVVVLDVSGSMGMEAAIVEASGQHETNGLTRRDSRLMRRCRGPDNGGTLTGRLVEQMGSPLYTFPHVRSQDATVQQLQRPRSAVLWR